MLTLLSDIPTKIKFPFGLANIIPLETAGLFPQQSATISKPFPVLANNFSDNLGSNALNHSSATPNFTALLPLASLVSVKATYL